MMATPRRPKRLAILGASGAALAISARAFSRRADGNRLLTDLLPTDLDTLKSEEVMRALAAQLLLFGGFTRSSSSQHQPVWRRDADQKLSLSQRLSRIAPTWKPGGRVDYSWRSHNGIFSVDSALPMLHGTTTVRQVAEALAVCTGRGGLTVVGGGDTAAAVEMAGVTAGMGHVSTGGGASLKLLEGSPLIGLGPLERA